MSPFIEIVEKKKKASIVYENETCMAIMDIHPIAPGHVIVFPKKHFSDIFAIDTGILADLSQVVQRVAHAMQANLQCDGINIFSNNGKAAQQTIPHFAFHVIPRWKGDNIRMLSRDSQLSAPADIQELEEVAQKIRLGLQ